MYAVGIVRILLWLAGLVWLAKTVVKPDPDEPLTWFEPDIAVDWGGLAFSLLTFGIPRWFGWRR